MGANSLLRRAVKKIIHPLIGQNQYVKIQAQAQAHDIRSGNWFEPEIELLESGVLEGETVLDLGANFGQYAFYLSKQVGEEGVVYSFEPIPYTFQTLQLVAQKLDLKNVKLINKGCGNENKRTTFRVPLQESGAFAAGQSYIGSRNDEHEGREHQVRWQGVQDVECEIVRIDDFLPELPNLSLIKADIEGAELFAFQGVEDHIKSHQPTIICEVNPWFLDGFGVKLEELVDFFVQKDYRMFAYKDRKLTEVSLKDVVEDNYVFIHPAKYSRFEHLMK